MFSLRLTAMQGNATNGVSYVTLPGTVAIAAQQSSALVTVHVLPALTAQGNELVVLTLSSTSTVDVITGVPSVATVTILQANLVTLNATVPTASVIGPSNGQFTVFIMTPLPTSTTFTYSVTGNATSGTVYVPLPGTVVIPVTNAR